MVDVQSYSQSVSEMFDRKKTANILRGQLKRFKTQIDDLQLGIH